MPGKSRRHGRGGRCLLELLQLLLLIEQLLLEDERLLILLRRRLLLIEQLQLELLLRRLVLEKLLLHPLILAQGRGLLLQLLNLQLPLLQIELLGAQLLLRRAGSLRERRAGQDEEGEEENKPCHDDLCGDGGGGLRAGSAAPFAADRW